MRRGPSPKRKTVPDPVFDNNLVSQLTYQILQDGLKDRAISRDLEWGIPLPVAGYEGKRIYVWFEAVAGYLSASKEWAANIGEPEAWRPFWQGDAKAYYFCLLYTSPSPRDGLLSRMPSSA